MDGPRRTAGLLSEHPAHRRRPMNEDTFNMEIRKFLKVVGVTSQREIEEAVREAVKAGKLKGNQTLKAKVGLTVDGGNLHQTIHAPIKLGRTAGPQPPRATR